MRILVVEDEKELLTSIAEGLRLSGYAVDMANNGDDGEYLALINAYDLIILDINLPGKDGFSILKSVRSEKKDVNIIMLTARSDIDDRVKGLDLGANDYMIKPFHFAELEARIRSLLRRRQVQQDVLLHCGDLLFDTRNKTAEISGKPLHLTGKESGILEYLLLNQGIYVSQEELLEHVWDDDMNAFSNTVRVHVSSLRRKIKAASGTSLIRNEIGKGYIIDSEKDH